MTRETTGQKKQADNIRKYVRDGGTFVAGFRLGVKDESSQVVNAPLPGLLRDVMGVTVRDPVPVYTDKIGVKFGHVPGKLNAVVGNGPSHGTLTLSAYDLSVLQRA